MSLGLDKGNVDYLPSLPQRDENFNYQKKGIYCQPQSNQL